MRTHFGKKQKEEKTMNKTKGTRQTAPNKVISRPTKERSRARAFSLALKQNIDRMRENIYIYLYKL